MKDERRSFSRKALNGEKPSKMNRLTLGIFEISAGAFAAAFFAAGLYSAKGDFFMGKSQLSAVLCLVFSALYVYFLLSATLLAATGICRMFGRDIVTHHYFYTAVLLLFPIFEKNIFRREFLIRLACGGETPVFSPSDAYSALRLFPFLAVSFSAALVLHLLRRKTHSVPRGGGILRIIASVLLFALSFCYLCTNFCGRLPLLIPFARVAQKIELALGKNEFCGAIIGKDGYIFEKKFSAPRDLFENVRLVADFANETKTPVYTFAVGEKEDILTSKLPRHFKWEREELFTAAKSFCGYIDTLPRLRLEANNGKYIFYRGDGKMTALGAYYIYLSAAEGMGFAPFKAQDFAVRVADSAFSGGSARKMLTKTNDRITLFRYKGDSALKVTRDGKDAELYDTSALYTDEVTDIFGGGGFTSITGGGTRRLLIVSDGIGDLVAPFLARHFDIDMINIEKSDVSPILSAEKNDYFAVIFIAYIGTLQNRRILY